VRRETDQRASRNPYGYNRWLTARDGHGSARPLAVARRVHASSSMPSVRLWATTNDRIVRNAARSFVNRFPFLSFD
jgi:hypothetical protein